MATKKGGLLEKNIKMLFDLIGFKSKNNVRIEDFEVDVYAKYEGVSILVECKQYESSNLNVNNLIFQWAGKNKKIKADKVLLVLYGSKVSDKHRRLAKEEGLIIWDDKDVHTFLDLAMRKKEAALIEILDNLDIRTEEVAKRREEKDRSWKPDYEQIGMALLFKNHRSISCLPGNYLLFNDDSPFGKGNIVNADGKQYSLEKLEDAVTGINKEELNPIDTLIFGNIDIGKEELELAEKNNIKCIVCRNIRTTPNGLFSKAPEIDISKTKVLILTQEQIKKSLGNSDLNRFFR